MFPYLLKLFLNLVCFALINKNWKWAELVYHCWHQWKGILLRCISIGEVFRMKTPATATHDSHYYTCLGHLGQLNTDRIISIGQGKYSSDCHILLLLTFLNTNFANVNMSLNSKALKPKYQPRRRTINILNLKKISYQ